VEKKSEKSSAAATAIDEEEIILNMVELEKENNKLSHFDMNNTYYTFSVNEGIMHLCVCVLASGYEGGYCNACDTNR
jgi:hypothetical protein